MKKVAMIPLRLGSERLPLKNYKLIDGVPIYEYQVLKAIDSGCFDEIYINSEDPTVEKTANRLGVNFYLRDRELASSSATSDEVVADFMENVCPDDSVLFWINTASPLTTVDDITSAVNFLCESESNTYVSVREAIGHVKYDGKPVNFSYDGGFAKTQDMKHAQEFTYAIMGWKSEFLPDLKSKRLFDENTVHSKLSFWSTVLMKTPEDYELITTLAPHVRCLPYLPFFPAYC